MSADRSFAFLPLAKAEKARRLHDLAQLAWWGFAPDEAMEHAGDVLKLDPSHASARLLQARIALDRCRPGEALHALDAHDQYGQGVAEDHEVGEHDAERLDAMLLRAASLARKGQTGLAIAQLEAMFELSPADLPVLRALGSLQLRDGREADAIETFTLLCDLDPGDSVAARALSDLLAAVAPSHSVEVLGRRDGGSTLRAARRCVKAGRLLDAETRYAELLDAHRGEAWLWLEAGGVAMQMGELTRAEERLMNAVELSDGRGELSRDAWEGLATQAMRRGRVSQAGRAWWRAIRCCSSDYATGWAGLLTCAMLAEREGLMRRADRTLRGLTTRGERRKLMAERWVDTVPAEFADPSARALGGSSSPLSAMLSQASSTLAEAASRFPGRADVRFHRAWALSGQGDLDSAMDEAGVALSINPNYAAARDLCVALSERRAA